MTRLSRFLRRAAGSPAPPQSEDAAGAGLAWWGGGEVCLALAAAVVASSAGCLIPQDVDKTPVILPPRIVVESLPSSYFSPFLTLTRATRDVGCTCELQLAIQSVAEDDPTVGLEGRWFIDYDLRVPASQRYTSSPLPGTFSFNQVTRTGPSLTVAPDTLGGDGFHTVDVVIGDANAFLTAQDPQAALPNRSLKGGFSAALYRFFVKVVTDADIPRCPEAPPLVIRSCNP